MLGIHETLCLISRTKKKNLKSWTSGWSWNWLPLSMPADWPWMLQFISSLFIYLRVANLQPDFLYMNADKIALSPHKFSRVTCWRKLHCYKNRALWDVKGDTCTKWWQWGHSEKGLWRKLHQHIITESKLTSLVAKGNCKSSSVRCWNLK